MICTGEVCSGMFVDFDENFADEIHEKGDRGGEKEVFLFSIGDRANSFFYSGCGRRLARGAKAT